MLQKEKVYLLVQAKGRVSQEHKGKLFGERMWARGVTMTSGLLDLQVTKFGQGKVMLEVWTALLEHFVTR